MQKPTAPTCIFSVNLPSASIGPMVSSKWVLSMRDVDKYSLVSMTGHH